MTEPRNFSWFVDGVLAGLAYPKEDSDIDFLAAEGVKVLVNLTPDNYYDDRAREKGVEVRPLPFPCFSPPSQADIKQFVEIVEQAKEKVRRLAVGRRAGLEEGGACLDSCLTAKPVRTTSSMQPALVYWEYTGNGLYRSTHHCSIIL